MALIVFSTALMFVLPSAMADPPEGGADQAASSDQETAGESTRSNNGSDITRPQTAFEVRFSEVVKALGSSAERGH